MRGKNAFLVEPRFFVLSKHKGRLMRKGIFELLEHALGWKTGLRPLWIQGSSLNRECLETLLQSSVAGSQEKLNLFMLEDLHPSNSWLSLMGLRAL